MKIPENLVKRGYLYFYSGARHPVERYLSTFHPARIVYRGEVFPSIEHAFQAAKFLYSDRPDLFHAAAMDASAVTAAKAKSLGSKTAFAKRRVVLNVESWNIHNKAVMRELVQARVREDVAFRSILERARQGGLTLYHYEKAFGKRGAEPYWGGYFRKSDGEFFGKNWLGKILMTTHCHSLGLDSPCPLSAE